ncbi:MAG: hypothetical protein M3R24_34505 [Chloroflexota bacterium]|nr:hypothetical protein [Chloroflexota bacterium]
MSQQCTQCTNPTKRHATGHAATHGCAARALVPRLRSAPPGLEGLVVAGFALTAIVLFWYRSDELMVLFVALMLLLLQVMNGLFVRSTRHSRCSALCRDLLLLHGRHHPSNAGTVGDGCHL